MAWGLKTQTGFSAPCLEISAPNPEISAADFSRE